MRAFNTHMRLDGSCEHCCDYDKKLTLSKVLPQIQTELYKIPSLLRTLTARCITRAIGTSHAYVFSIIFSNFSASVGWTWKKSSRSL